MKVLILAGGFATRLWPLSEVHAKPLLLINGKTILAHLFDIIPASAEVILLTNQKFAADFRAELTLIGRKTQTEIFCEDSVADGEKLGALGAIAAVCKEYEIDENIFVFAGDNLLPNLTVADLACEETQAKLAVREVKTLDEARKFGVVEVKPSKKLDLTVTNFEEKPEKPKSKLVSTGFLGIGRTLLPALIEFAAAEPDALGGVFPEFLHQGAEVLARKVDGDWFDIGSFETYLGAHEQLQREPVLLGKSVKKSQNTLSGKVFLADGASVKNCKLHNVIVYPNTKLSNCIISNSIIDSDCDLAGVDLNQKLIRRNTNLQF